jgi:Domain of unknown function (DUF4375)
VNKNSILIDLSESDKTKFGKQGVATQSTPQQVFSSTWAIETEVNNGGFAQYFPSNSCETAASVAEALNSIGAPRTADICRRAIATAFPAGLPSSPDSISAAAADFCDETQEHLEALDSEFFEYRHNLTDCCSLTCSSTQKSSDNCPSPKHIVVGDKSHAQRGSEGCKRGLISINYHGPSEQNDQESGHSAAKASGFGGRVSFAFASCAQTVRGRALRFVWPE